ncbi:MAG TPA: beta-ketoacyl synthase N-terminal-like domain-containing protein [Pyrinomonadaceae bacterium]|nr:beta-ketoacyl synthase N-terminal-like domain-containing protein [Pyrinomonadaceae bacterium]
MSRSHARAEDSSTLIELLRWRAEHQPARHAYTYLADGEAEEGSLTYAELDERARAVASWLQSLGAAGDRALLLYPPGLDFIAAFFGCLYAGVVAVPVYPPHPSRPEQTLARLRAVVADAQAALMMTTTKILSRAESLFVEAPDLRRLKWLATDSEESPAKEWREPPASGETLCFLQYTSGSTSAPKGVMVSHRNLLRNSAYINHMFSHTPESVGVTWLPAYHDMGLIDGIIQPLYSGFSGYLMPPVAFIQRPHRWLQAMTKYKATHTGGPNFGYEHCVRQIKPEQRTGLDLSNWRVAYNGAEPIRLATLRRFAEAYAPYGFRWETFYPAYGLAESTLKVTGGYHAGGPIACAVETAALEENRVVEARDDETNVKHLVGSGRTALETKVIIVEPVTRTQCEPGQVGEIWVASESVAQGYWNRPELSEEIFRARLSDTGVGPFLRTGDLGFWRDDELFVTGRLKDLIIIRGQNHYPQDIEWTAEQSHTELRQGCSAAFSVEVSGAEQLVIAAEVQRHFEPSQMPLVFDAIRQKVAEDHELEVYAISLLKTGALPKTSSGKTQRHACRNGFLAGSLNVVGEWRRKSAEQPTADESLEVVGQLADSSAPTSEAIQAWLVARIATRASVAAHEVDTRRPFTSYGLDSLAGATLAADLGEWLGRELSPTLVYDYPTIDALSQYLAGLATPSNLARVTQARVTEERTATQEPIAIIGIGCRFPGAHGPEAFWQLLRDGVDAVTDVPQERLEWRGFMGSDYAASEKGCPRRGGFLPQVDQFDAAFFAISPREAAQMDPQQRLLLETAWEALEDAGQAWEQLTGSQTGVFIGLSSQEYAALQMNSAPHLDAYATTGSAISIAANRLSYFFDFRGPSMTIDTACSASLVAVHLACQSLRSGEATLALAGGVNLILSPRITLGFAQAGATSKDGRCKAFDARADGIVRSEGVGVVVLKPLSRALADGDPVYAVIRGSATGQDGRSNGITAPSAQAQEAVLRDAYERAGVSPGRVQYVETHGTGTLLGDPIEATALGRVLSTDRLADRPCAIGSVKTNIGHTEAAAGIASLIKVALAIKHRAIPPSLHFHEPNPHIPFAELQLRVQQAFGEWPEGDVLAGVSAFGFGGTNAHVILEEALELRSTTQPKERDADAGWYLLPLSAQTAEALRARAHAYREFLEEDAGALSLSDICYTASARRSHHDYRLAIAARSSEEVRERLENYERGEVRSTMTTGHVTSGRRRKLVFVCSGYGAQWSGMGRELFNREPVFQETITRCDELLRQHLPWSLIEELLAEKERSRLDGSNVEVTQVALFAIQVALAAVWRSWGIEPDAVVGHSLGEVAAAHLSGALTLNDAVRVIATRARLMQQALQQSENRGAMAAVELPLEEARRALAGYEDRVSIAVHNTPKAVVMAGEAAALDEILETFRQREIVGRLLDTPGAGHSPEVAGVERQLNEALRGLLPQQAKIPIFSTVTGHALQGEAFDPAYWARNVREPVLFCEALESLGAEGYDLFLELSPLPILSPAILQCWSQLHEVTVLASLRLSRQTEVTVLPSLRRRQEDRAVMLKSLATLYAEGFTVDWRALYGEPGRCVHLPSYPWQRERYWIAERTGEQDAQTTTAKPQAGRNGNSNHPLLGHHVRSAAHAGTHLWEMDLSNGFSPYTAGDGRIGANVLMPPMAYMEMALAAAEEAFGAGPYALEDMDFCEALVLPQDKALAPQMQLVISGEVSTDASFQFFSLNAGASRAQSTWTLHARGKIRPGNPRAN